MEYHVFRGSIKGSRTGMGQKERRRRQTYRQTEQENKTAECDGRNLLKDTAIGGDVVVGAQVAVGRLVCGMCVCV